MRTLVLGLMLSGWAVPCFAVTAETPAASAATVREKAADAAQAAKEYSLQQKEEYQKAVEAKLDALGHKIDEFKAKAAGMGDQARTEVRHESKKLDGKMKVARKKLKKVKAASAKALKDLRKGLDDAVDDVGQACDKAFERFR